MTNNNVLEEAVSAYQHLRSISGSPARKRYNRSVSQKLEGSQPFTSGRDPESLGSAIKTLSSQLGWSGSLSQSELLAAWPKLVGEDISKHSELIAIENGVLQVRCETTAWATQLRLMRKHLIERILQEYPDARVDSIRFQGPDAPTWKKGPRSIPGRGPRDTYG